MSATIHIRDIAIGPGRPLLIIAGPCVIESYDQCVQVGQAMADKCRERGLSYIFKASFDKANRSSIHSKRGPGLDEGLRILQRVGQALGVPVTTDIHESSQAPAAGQAVDLVQIPAFLCRQTDLLLAAAATGKPVNVKKGQFLSPAEMKQVIAKLTEAKAAGIMLTERGTFFGYHRLVNDFLGLGDMMDLSYPVCFDVTHSTQQPGGEGDRSGGRPDRAPLLARAAVATGVHALFLECHPDPPRAFSDAATVLPIPVALGILEDAARLRQAMSGR
jgi:2-dehydro-3-deoxyphosphooctonate aldolase (KDO 8-P synthase)